LITERPVTDDGRKGPTVQVVQEVLRFEYPRAVGDFQVWRFVTSFLFTNDWFLGLLFGMLLLYFFGGELEVLYGTGRFVVFYLLAGLLANGVKVLLAISGMGVAVPTAGTSAPMFATLVLFASHYPHRPIRLWFLLPIPVWLLVALYLGLQLLVLLGSVAARDTNALPLAVEPIVGAVFGFVFHRTRGRLFAFADAAGGLLRKRERRSPADLRLYDDDEPQPAPRPTPPEPVPQPAGSRVDEHLEAKLDAVLAKVARQGKGSLTAEENEILMRASEVFKRKRR
jgi:membrane associated rhomboid family serine protease